jgi:hypothetical protein
MYLLFTDPHFDDNRANEYRWRVFDELARVCRDREVSHVFCLGDMTDKRDRFSAEMVNRLVRCWTSLPVDERVILRGNHDTPVAGSAFWDFLSEIDGITYVTRPTSAGDLLLLPFSPSPRSEWSEITWRNYRAAFLHATPRGVLAENGFRLEGQDLPILPGRLKIYSGDVHTPQRVRNWTLVGAPHPVKFGESHPYRFLLLDERSYGVVEEVALSPIGKRAVEITSLDDLAAVETRSGDQVQVRLATAPGAVDWGAFESAVDEWARERGVDVTFGGSYDLPAQVDGPSGELSPEELLRAFATEERVTDELLDVGLELLREVS